MMVASSMIELGQIKTALIVTGENSGPIYPHTIKHLNENPTQENFRDSLASLTLGSGAVAYILQHSSLASSRHQLLGGITQADSKYHSL